MANAVVVIPKTKFRRCEVTQHRRLRFSLRGTLNLGEREDQHGLEALLQQDEYCFLSYMNLEILYYDLYTNLHSTQLKSIDPTDVF